MVWYFIRVYIIINRTLHGRLETRNFSSRVEKKEKIRISARPCNILYKGNKLPGYNPACGTAICDFHAFWLTRMLHRLKSTYRTRSCRQASEYVSVVSNLPFSYILKPNALLHSLLPHQQHCKGNINSDKLQPLQSQGLVNKLRKASPRERQSNTVLDNGFHEFRIAGTGFQSFWVELGFWIPIVSGIPDSTSKFSQGCHQDFKLSGNETAGGFFWFFFSFIFLWK